HRENYRTTLPRSDETACLSTTGNDGNLDQRSVRGHPPSGRWLYSRRENVSERPRWKQFYGCPARRWDSYHGSRPGKVGSGYPHGYASSHGNLEGDDVSDPSGYG